MKLPRNAQIWGPGYIQDRFRHLFLSPPSRIWVTIADHWEPMWRQAELATARARVQLWCKNWPRVSEHSVRDTVGNPPKYTFFFPEEQYRWEFVEPLAEMSRTGLADLEVHIHHDGGHRADFLARMQSFCHLLEKQHGLLRRRQGLLQFGFIHGNWALDNSLPGGRGCGLNDEITLLRQLGCYADLTMPCAPEVSQARMINTIYWAKDDPERPKSYDRGIAVVIGGGVEGDLLMIPGPLGLRWTERLVPRIETGDLSASDPPTEYRVRCWFELAPRLGSDAFLKLYTHGAQEKNSSLLLEGGLQSLFAWIKAEAGRRRCELYFVTAWQMYLAIEALRERRDPVAAVLDGPIPATAAIG